ncbi:MAG TPA: hypothetical protein VFG09_06640 [Thermodesulfovibrionales bacterium]|nr:hypothetical protein [Thermodesulfovibrionales bacterium]
MKREDHAHVLGGIHHMNKGRNLDIRKSMPFSAGEKIPEIL